MDDLNQKKNEEKAILMRNLDALHERMAAAAERAGRDPQKLRLVAVTKQVDLYRVQTAAACGLDCFGENYPEQALDKIQSLDGRQKIEWHMIGHIQSRKSDTVAAWFDRVHSVDRMKIARRLQRDCQALDKVMPVLMEVNLTGEESKYGWPAWDELAWNNLVPSFEEIGSMQNLHVDGLMSMPPFFDDPENTRPVYQKLRRLQSFLKTELPSMIWDELSIGTSFDYEVAIEEGATFVRVGTALFGPRS
jgi:PLP dependent protein